MEVTALVFGILPVVIEIVKSYETARERLHTLRHHCRAIQRIQVKFRVEESSFRNECRLLLRLVIEDGQDLHQMLSNTTDSRWRDRGINEQFRRCLDSDYDL